MRWLRDNWIDALIFTVFAITVIGIVLFLTGVNPFKAKAPAVSVPAVSQPAAQAAKPPEAQPQTPAGQKGGEENQPVTVVPLLPGSEKEGESAATQKPQASKPQASANVTRPAKPAAASSSGLKLPGGPEKGVFRVSVGAFGKPENALALAEKLQKQGYPVRLEPVGRVTRVAVGPYDTRSKAAAAAAKLAGYEPQVYRGDTPEPQQLYLQVGAYKNLGSAAPLVAKLRDAGIGPIVFYYKEPWLKVWIGPVDQQKAGELKQRLRGLGLDVVEVR